MLGHPDTVFQDTVFETTTKPVVLFFRFALQTSLRPQRRDPFAPRSSWIPTPRPSGRMTRSTRSKNSVGSSTHIATTSRCFTTTEKTNKLVSWWTGTSDDSSYKCDLNNHMKAPASTESKPTPLCNGISWGTLIRSVTLVTRMSCVFCPFLLLSVSSCVSTFGVSTFGQNI